jgi:HTH-type transcriptional regulator / antitoxin HigA
MTTATPEQLTQAWRELQALVPVTVIHTEQQYDRAITTLNMLIDTVGLDEIHPLYDLLDTLGTLVQAYEEQHEVAPVPTNVDILRFFMAEHDLSIVDLPELGDAEMVDDILSAKRPLTSPQLHALARRFGVVPETFVTA